MKLDKNIYITNILVRIFASARASADLHPLIFACASASADLHAQMFAYASASADVEILASDTSVVLPARCVGALQLLAVWVHYTCSLCRCITPVSEHYTGVGALHLCRSITPVSQHE